MNRKLRRDRNAFLVFLAAVPISLLVALPLAVQNGNQYVAAKARQQMQAQQHMQSGAGATQPATESASESSGK